MSTAPALLGGLGAQDFLSDYWQQQPLLVRQALPGYRSPVSADELAGLALEADVESRLVRYLHPQDLWTLQHGPLAASDFQQTGERNWTLLVQALDLWVPAVRELLPHFDFLPPWRLDDVMASYAAPGGSVGPHVDQYDVFLLQVEGQRRWQIGTFCDGSPVLRQDTDLSLLANFEATQEWVLDPGDMLYLPPQLSHWGTAVTECVTFSIGFRSPNLADMLGDLAVELLAQGRGAQYRDPPLQVSMANSQIDPAFIDAAKRQLQALLEDESLLADWFARYMTAPKYPELVLGSEEQRRASIAGAIYVNGELAS